MPHTPSPAPCSPAGPSSRRTALGTAVRPARRGGAARTVVALVAAVAFVAAGCSDDPDTRSATTTSTSTSTSTTTTVADGGTTTTTTPTSAAAKAGHVWVINLENKGYDATFAADSPIPYLAKDLVSQGVLLTQYFATSHLSLGNYIAQVSGQGPTPEHNQDCPRYTDLTVTSTLPHGEVTGSGCVYPSSVITIGDQLDAKKLTWRQYGEDMLNDQGSGQPTSCRHPAIGAVDDTLMARPGDSYATRHLGFLYFHSVIDSPGCSNRVVDLRALDGDLATVDATPNLSFISPNLCNDGHDETCADGTEGGYAAANRWLAQWVPHITASPAFRQDGLLIVTFDEAETGDTAGCCGQTAGGGRVGAVIIGKGVQAGITDDTPYNHYSLLCSLENLWGLERLARAADPQLACFIQPQGGGAASKA